MDLMPWKNIRKLRDIIDIMDKTSAEIFEGKKRALEEGDEAVSKQVGQGKDMMSILSTSINILSSIYLPFGIFSESQHEGLEGGPITRQ